MRLIDADAFNHFDYSCFDGQLSEDAIQGMDTVLNVIDTAPTIDAEPVRHGHWIPWLNAKDEFGKQFTAIHMCSECKTANHYYPTDYCPDCGADMRGGHIE